MEETSRTGISRASVARVARERAEARLRALREAVRELADDAMPRTSTADILVQVSRGLRDSRRYAGADTLRNLADEYEGEGY